MLQSTLETFQKDVAHLMAKAIRRKSSATGTEIVALPSGTKPMEHIVVLQSTLQQRDASQGMDRAIRRMSSVSGMETLQKALSSQAALSRALCTMADTTREWPPGGPFSCHQRTFSFRSLRNGLSAHVQISAYVVSMMGHHYVRDACHQRRGVIGWSWAATASQGAVASHHPMPQTRVTKALLQRMSHRQACKSIVTNPVLRRSMQGSREHVCTQSVREISTQRCYRARLHAVIVIA